MDNQQERPEADLNWLGGLIDGEGHIGVSVKRDGKGRFHLQAVMQVFNTSPTILAEALRVLERYELPKYVKTRPAGQHRRTMPCSNIGVTGIKRVKRWLDVLGPYIRGKQDQVQYLRAFTESRLSKSHVSPYSEQEVEWAVALRETHGDRPRVSPETIRQTLGRQIIGAPFGNTNRRRAKIESDLRTKDGEASRNV